MFAVVFQYLKAGYKEERACLTTRTKQGTMSTSCAGRDFNLKRKKEHFHGKSSFHWDRA